MIIKLEMDKEMYKAMKRYEKAREENNEEEMAKAKEEMEMYNKFRNNEKKTNIIQNTIQNTILPLLKIGVDVAGIVLPLMFYSKWVSEGLKFEQEGTFTSQTFKSLMAKMKPTK